MFHICLIGICKNIETIVLRGFNTTLTKELIAALARADLISLDLSCRPLGDYWSLVESSVPLSELINTLQSWSRLERVRAYLGEFFWMDGGESELVFGN